MAAEFHLVRADGSGSLEVFDTWGPHVLDAWHRASKKQAVNLIAMHPCGCLYRALVTYRKVLPLRFGRTRRELGGWRRVERCSVHSSGRKATDS